MFYIWWLFYNLLFMPILVLLAYLSAPMNRKVRRGLRGRRKSMARIREFSEQIKDSGRPLYWFHAASLGEYEQSRPVIEGLREVSPDAGIAVSFFSPSGFEQCAHEAIDFKFYLPLDFPWTMRRALRLLQPHRVLFAAYDIWPNHIWACRAAGVATVLFAARVAPTSKKQWPVLRNFFRHVYGAIRHIYTISDTDHARIVKMLGAASESDVRSMGNPRYDRVAARNSNGEALKRKHDERIIILGSLHKGDHQVIAPVIIGLLKQDPHLKVVWAPHDPEPEVLDSIEAELSDREISWERYGRRFGRFRDKQVLIIDGVGYLAENYGRGILAYVGGGFGSGVHNVMEPAIAGIPVIFGPNYQRSEEAVELIKRNGGKSVGNQEEFQQIISGLLNDEAERERIGAIAIQVIETNLGAGARIVHAILEK